MFLRRVLRYFIQSFFNFWFSRITKHSHGLRFSTFNSILRKKVGKIGKMSPYIILSLHFKRERLSVWPGWNFFYASFHFLKVMYHSKWNWISISTDFCKPKVMDGFFQGVQTFFFNDKIAVKTFKCDIIWLMHGLLHSAAF